MGQEINIALWAEARAFASEYGRNIQEGTLSSLGWQRISSEELRELMKISDFVPLDLDGGLLARQQYLYGKTRGGSHTVARFILIRDGMGGVDLTAYHVPSTPPAGSSPD